MDVTLFDRVEQSHDKKTKVATIEDLHQRLKSNIESIQQLNTQVSGLLLCYTLCSQHCCCTVTLLVFDC